MEVCLQVVTAEWKPRALRPQKRVAGKNVRHGEGTSNQVGAIPQSRGQDLHGDRKFPTGSIDYGVDATLLGARTSRRPFGVTRIQSGPSSTRPSPASGRNAFSSSAK